jgi:hypothetical protein
MTALTWDQVGERFYETGVDHGVLYPTGADGVAWNGLTTVTETPAGAEATPTYADNIKYLNLISIETFGGTIEAYTYPDEFGECDGSMTPSPGVLIGQQSRKQFGLSYRTRLGNDVDGTDHGYKLHLVYGATASPSEKAYASINDTPEAITFSWEFSTIPVPVTDAKPTALITIDSTKVDPAALADLELILYGDVAVDPRLPLPDEVVGVFEGTLTEVRLTGANAPTYNSGTHIVTLPTVTGITWSINGVEATPGAQPAMTTGQTSLVTAVASSGYRITGDDDWTFDY